MKLKKLLSAVVAGVLCVSAMAVTASAEVTELTFPKDLSKDQYEFKTLTEGIDLEVFKTVKTAVVEFTNTLTDEQIAEIDSDSNGAGAVVLYGDYQGWNWDSGVTRYWLKDVLDGKNKLVFDLTKNKGYKGIENATNSTLNIGVWWTTYKDLGISKIWVSDEVVAIENPYSAPVAEAEATEAPAAEEATEAAPAEETPAEETTTEATTEAEAPADEAPVEEAEAPAATEAPAVTEAPATEAPVEVTTVVEAAPADDASAANASAGDTNAASTADKGSVATGMEGVAVVIGLAVVATGAVIVSKKRK